MYLCCVILRTVDLLLKYIGKLKSVGNVVININETVTQNS